MKIALYVRVSLAAKDGAGQMKQDYENQLIELRAFVERKASDGWELGEVYADKVSGKTGERPAFKRMMQNASEKRFDCLLFWSLDRLSREGVLETLQYLRKLTAHGVDWWSFKEEYLRSIGPWRDAVLGLLATVAAQERVRIVDRTVAGMNRARKAGKHLGRPFAESAAVEGGKAKHVRLERVQELHAKGLSLRQIAEETGISFMTVGRMLRRAS
jgi:DNA invertase Pin-like site-specific DNA recombinase